MKRENRLTIRVSPSHFTLRNAWLMALMVGLASWGCSTAGEHARPYYEVFAPWRAWNGDLEETRKARPDEAIFWEEAEQLLLELGEAEQIVMDDELTTYFDLVLDRMDPELRKGYPGIRVLALRSVERNAYANANGDILITTSLLASLDNEGQLAYLVGHEVGHVMRRHFLTHALYREIAPSHVDRMILSRVLEREADEVGFLIAHQAAYDPDEAAKLLGHYSSSDTSTFGRMFAWEMHAPTEIRISNLKRLARFADRNDLRGNDDRFENAVDGVRLEVVEAELKARLYESAESVVAKHLERNPTSSRAYFLRAEIRRRTSPKGRTDALVRRDYESAVEYDGEDAESVRALGLLLLDLGELSRARALLGRYIEIVPDAIDRKIIEGYLAQ